MHHPPHNHLARPRVSRQVSPDASRMTLRNIGVYAGRVRTLGCVQSISISLTPVAVVVNMDGVCMCSCRCCCSRGVCAGRVRALGWAKSAPISLVSAPVAVGMDGFCICCCILCRFHKYVSRAACPIVLASCRTSASCATSEFSDSIR